MTTELGVLFAGPVQGDWTGLILFVLAVAAAAFGFATWAIGTWVKGLVDRRWPSRRLSSGHAYLIAAALVTAGCFIYFGYQRVTHTTEGVPPPQGPTFLGVLEATVSEDGRFVRLLVTTPDPEVCRFEFDVSNRSSIPIYHYVNAWITGPGGAEKPEGDCADRPLQRTFDVALEDGPPRDIAVSGDPGMTLRLQADGSYLTERLQADGTYVTEPNE